MVTRGKVEERPIFELTLRELNALPYGVISLDRSGTITRYNDTEAAFARRSPASTVGLNFFTDVAPCTNVHEFKGRFDRFARPSDSGVERFDFTFAFRWGSQDVSITFVRKAGHDDIYCIVRARNRALLDPAPSMPAEAASRNAGDGAAAAAVAPLAFRELDCAAWEVGSVEESAWRATIHPDDLAGVLRAVANALERRRPYVVEYRTLSVTAKPRIVQEHGGFVSGTGERAFATIVDVTDQRQQMNRLLQAAHYDVLTGLPNRALLLERIAAAARECRAGNVAAVLAIGVASFESLSDTFGVQTGNELLRLMALRLGEAVRGGDTVARLSDDVFVVLLTAVDDVEGVAAGAARILATLARPFSLDGRTHQLFVSLGISVSPRNGLEAPALLQAAETAMSASRKEARSRAVWFSGDLAAEAARHLRTEDELRLALERGEFVLHYQPIVDIATGRTVAAEALVRWNHPERGLVMPDDFIAIAERTGIIWEIGTWVLRAACSQGRSWLDAGREMLVCANVSSVQFRRTGFADVVSAALGEAGLPARLLELELTESVMIDGLDDVIETLTKLKLVGVRLAVDDFGIGYSSLAYLKYFPIDTVKIDRIFVADIVHDPFDRAIAKSVLSLAEELRVDCVAEGVETKEQLEVLRELGCRRVQGYYFSRPKAPSALGNFQP